MNRLNRSEKKQLIAAVIYVVFALVLVVAVSVLAEQAQETDTPAPEDEIGGKR
jgi:hypothetical protein